MSRFSSLIAILVASFAVAPVAEAADRIVLKRQAGLSAAERADVRADADVTLERTLGIAGVEVVVADDGNRALSELRADRDVVWAEPDRLRSGAADPLAELEWALDNSGQSVWGAPRHARRRHRRAGGVGDLARHGRHRRGRRLRR